MIAKYFTSTTFYLWNSFETELRTICDLDDNPAIGNSCDLFASACKNSCTIIIASQNVASAPSAEKWRSVTYLQQKCPAKQNAGIMLQFTREGSRDICRYHQRNPTSPNLFCSGYQLPISAAVAAVAAVAAAAASTSMLMMLSWCLCSQYAAPIVLLPRKVHFSWW